MDINKCYEILEVNKDATPDQVKQAYKDLVNIWHPDRVSNNPRLKQKAEDKLKEINTAYEKVNLHLSSTKQNVAKSNLSTSTYPVHNEKKSVTPDHPPDHHHFQSKAENREGSKRVLNQDQSVLSNLWSSFSSLFRQIRTRRLSLLRQLPPRAKHQRRLIDRCRQLRLQASQTAHEQQAS